MFPQFLTPPLAPKAVGDAIANFDRLCLLWQETNDGIADELEACREAVGEANKAHAAARVESSAPPKINASKIQAVSGAKVNALRGDLEILSDACRQARQEMFIAIDANRGPWIQALEDADAIETERLAAAIEDARGTVQAIRPLRSGPDWLANFDLTDVALDRQSQFAGGHLSVACARFARQFDDFVTPEAIIDLLNDVVSPPKPPEPRTLDQIRAPMPHVERVI